MDSNKKLQKILLKFGINKERRKTEYEKIRNNIIELLNENTLDYMTSCNIYIDNLKYEILGCEDFYIINKIIDIENGKEELAVNICFYL